MNEEWRYKVTHFESLNGVRPTLPEYAKRVAHVKAIVVKHPNFNEVFSELEEIHALSKESVITDQLCILGPTGAGKTTLVDEYVANFPRQVQKERTVIPVLNVKVPPRARFPKVLASKILRTMGDPLFDSGTEENMTHRIQNFVKACRIEIIILDEFQHLIDRDTDHVLATASDWLKTFIEEINIPVVLCELPESERIFKHNEQLDGRYPNRAFLHPFSFSTTEEKLAFRKFLKAIDHELPFSKLSNLADPDVAGKLYYFSFGVPRYVMDLLKQATKFALKKGQDHVCEVDLGDAFQKITRSIRPFAINPFANKNFNLDEEIEKERLQQESLFKQNHDRRRKQKK
ncbi:TniB family NTP-binding protein [Aneurinibacillus sp. REN35]|uniref:TniB family NTP-binding protein n=1 Tax=Aneurinibacillus sp. REN35 TaxID=3237286 RepID=UPI0035292F11